jgi:hypothetical protein
MVDILCIHVSKWKNAKNGGGRNKEERWRDKFN